MFVLQLTLLLTLSTAMGWLLRSRAPAAAHMATVIGAMLALLLLATSGHDWPGRERLYLTAPSWWVETTSPIDLGNSEAKGTDVSVTSAGGRQASAGDGIGDPTAGWTARQTVLVAWVGGSLVLGALWLIGVLRVRRVVDRAQANESLRRRLALLSRHRLHIKTSAETRSAFLWFGREPEVILPADAEQWPIRHLHAAVLHELAHHARADNVRFSLLRLTRIVYWWHPFAWIMSSLGRECAEIACDAEALERGLDRLDYAESLVALARRHVPDAGLASLHGNGIARRIGVLLSTPKPAWRFVPTLALSALLLFGVGIGRLDATIMSNTSTGWIVQSATALTPHRFGTYPQGRFQMAAFYDGDAARPPTVAVEFVGLDGRHEWLALPPLKKFGDGLTRVEWTLAPQVRPTGRVAVRGLVPDGVVDGVALGMAWRGDQDSAPLIQRTRDLSKTALPRTVCAWPLALTAERSIDGGHRIPHWEMDTVQRLLCGADLVADGDHAL
jgi:beta-lactamase regulating signal transducer with metallopeptidase domain